MNFLNPLALIGLIAASIPVLLHLLNLRKLKTVEFSSLKFLKELQKNKIKKLKLKQILLLILRTLIVIFAVLAFARPTIKGVIPGFESYATSSVVILIDNSPSMDVSDEYGNRLNQAKKAASAIIKTLREGDEAVIIETSNTTGKEQYNMSRNFNVLEDKIKSVKISNMRSDIDKALSYAGIILKESKNYNKEVFIISDAQKNIYQSSDTTKFAEKNVGVYLIPVGYKSKSENVNLSVDSLYVVTGIFQVGKPVEVNAIIKNNSTKEVKGALASLIFNGERVAQRSVDIPGGESRSVAIAAPAPNSGAIKACIELENDALELDNRRFFGFIIPEKPRVAIIGDASATAFIDLALGGASNSNLVQGRVLNAGDLSSLDLGSYDAIILSNGKYREGDLTRIKKFVENGGGLLVFASDATEKKDFDEFLSGFGFGNSTLRTFKEDAKARFTSSDIRHPLFEGVFKPNASGQSVIESPQITKAFTVNGGQSIIETSGGNFLTESRIGSGKVIYCAVSPESSWSSFTLTGVFPALIYRSCYYLTIGENVTFNSEPGITSTVTLSKRYAGSGDFKVIEPNGSEVFRKAALLPAGAALSLDDMKELGVYSVYNAQGKPVSTISLNISKNESYPASHKKEDLLSDLNTRITDKSLISFIENPDDIQKGVQRARTGTELWRFFLMFALICAVAEMIIQKASKKDLE